MEKPRAICAASAALVSREAASLAVLCSVTVMTSNPRQLMGPTRQQVITITHKRLDYTTARCRETAAPAITVSVWATGRIRGTRRGRG